MSSHSHPRRSTLCLSDGSRVTSTLTRAEVQQLCDPDTNTGPWPLITIPRSGPHHGGNDAVVGAHQIVRVLESR